MKKEVLLAVIADRSEKDSAEITRVYNDKGLFEVVKTALLPIANTKKFMQFMADFGPEVAMESVSAYQLLAKPALQRVLNEHYQMPQSVWDFFSANAETLVKTILRSQVAKVTFVLLESVDEKGNPRRALWDEMFTTPSEVRQFCQNLIDEHFHTEALNHINISNWRSYRWLLHDCISRKAMDWHTLLHKVGCGALNLPLRIQLRRAIAA